MIHFQVVCTADGSTSFRQCLGTLLCLFMLLALNAQTNDPAHKRRKLVAGDYKGVPDESSGFLARTYVLLSFYNSGPVNCLDKNKVRFQFETKVSVSDKSWMKLNMIKSQELLIELLSHEQGHYDINEIFAIDLKNKMSAICFDKNKYKAEIDSAFKVMNRYYDSLQLAYDTQTGNMGNRDMQARWKQKIDGMLLKVNNNVPH